MFEQSIDSFIFFSFVTQSSNMHVFMGVDINPRTCLQFDLTKYHSAAGKICEKTHASGTRHEAI